MPQKPSTKSLLIKSYFNDMLIGSSTGFVVRDKSDKSYLITNWHVVSGRDTRSGKVLSKECAIPNKLAIYYPITTKNHSREPLSTMIAGEPLLAIDGSPLWLEHPQPQHRELKIDVVALPITSLSGAQVDSYAIEGSSSYVNVTAKVMIIGFPYGEIGTHPYAIWTGGTLASEPSINYRGMPAMLIDSRTRQGQSGSPTVFYYQRNNNMIVSSDRSDPIYYESQMDIDIVGVYSGRISEESDLGIVWRKELIDEIISLNCPGEPFLAQDLVEKVADSSNSCAVNQN